ncbi:MAG TPA: hypothetical protein P5289_00650 [Bacteroidales bacterium]|nr:hypothetical protein [Bacteroidales bacterium]HRT72023.1 hypothetical protein [Bacteroidales bacterium]
MPILYLFLFGIIIYISTFPVWGPDISKGLDASYVWAINFLFQNDYSSLTKLIFPIGPLGFLKMPTAISPNLEIAITFYTIMKLWFIYVFMWVGNNQKWNIKPTAALLCFIAALILPFDYILIGIVMLHALLIIETNKPIHFIPISFWVSIALLIKSSIGIIGFSVLTIIWLLYLIRNRDLKKSVLWASICILIVMLIGSITMLGIKEFVVFFINTLRLSFGYSEALTLYPHNNIFLLIGFIITVLMIPILINEKNTRIAFIAFIFPLFAVWKHAMSRQDTWHYSSLVVFMVLFWILLIIYTKKYATKLIILALLNITFIYANIKYIPMYDPIKIEINGINNFYKTVIKFNTFQKTYIEQSQKNLEECLLDPEILTLLDNNTVDIYPWELTYAAANKLNYKARKTLQAGSFATWLDKKSAQDFDLVNGPEYLIFHFVKDRWGGNFGSIDQRYLLNDNPKTILQILTNYTVVYKNNEMLLLKKTHTPQFDKPVLQKLQQNEWNQWIEIPDANQNIIRLKAKIKSSILGVFTSFFYKPSTCYIDYKMKDGKILTYRFIPNNALDGLWVHPFIQHPTYDIIESQVVAIRLRNNNNSAFSNKIKTQFEIITPSQQNVSIKNNAYSVLGKTFQGNSKIIADIQLSIFANNQQPNKIIAINDKPSNYINGQEFSNTLIISLDSITALLNNNSAILFIETYVDYNSNEEEAFLVISGEGNANSFWEPQKLLTNEDSYYTGNTYNAKILHILPNSCGIIKSFIWNPNKTKIHIKDFRLRIRIISE